MSVLRQLLKYFTSIRPRINPNGHGRQLASRRMGLIIASLSFKTVSFLAFLTLAPLSAQVSTGHGTLTNPPASPKTSTLSAPIPLPPTPTQSELATAGWQLVWDDEFEKEGWPDSSKWGYETGMLRNSEPQYYIHSMDNVRVTSKGLEMIIRKEHVSRDRNGHSAEFTSASIDTSGKASWLYGRFEIQAVIPPGKFVWPAFWMMGIDRLEGVFWPKCGEVDIAEYFGRYPNPGVFSSVHFYNPSKPPPQHASMIQGNTHGLCVTSVLHTYTMEWYPDRLDFYVDGWKYNSIPMSRIDDDGWGAFRKPMFLRLSLAMDKFGMPADPAYLPARLLIRCVRVYQKQGAGLN